jgi:hypothetical protein
VQYQVTKVMLYYVKRYLLDKSPNDFLT